MPTRIRKIIFKSPAEAMRFERVCFPNAFHLTQKHMRKEQGGEFDPKFERFRLEMEFLITSAAQLGRIVEKQITLYHGGHTTPEKVKEIVNAELDRILGNIKPEGK